MTVPAGQEPPAGPGRAPLSDAHAVAGYRRTGRARRLARSIAATAHHDIGATLYANLALTGLGFLTGLLAARLLGPVGRGQLAAVQLWPTVLVYLGSGGIMEAVTYTSGREPSRAGRIASTGLALLLSASVFLIAGGAVTLPHLLASQSARTIHTAELWMLSVPASFVGLVPFAILRGTSRLRLWNVLRVTPPIGYLGLLLVAFRISHGRLTFILLGLLAWLALANLALGGYILARYIRGPRGFDSTLVRPLLRYSGLSLTASAPGWLNGRLDQLVMAAVLPSRSLGLYALGVSWSAVFSQVVPAAFSQVILPRLTAARPEDVSTRLTTTGRSLSLCLLLGGASFLALTAPAMRILFGPAFTDAIPAALVLVVAALFLGISAFLEESFRGLGRPGVASLAELAGLAITLPGLYVFLPRLGIMGAALVSLASYATVAAALVYLIWRIAAIRPADLLVPRRADLRAVMVLLSGRTRQKSI